MISDSPWYVFLRNSYCLLETLLSLQKETHHFSNSFAIFALTLKQFSRGLTDYIQNVGKINFPSFQSHDSNTRVDQTIEVWMIEVCSHRSYYANVIGNPIQQFLMTVSENSLYDFFSSASGFSCSWKRPRFFMIQEPWQNLTREYNHC